MNYEEFKSRILEELPGRLPGKLKGATLEVGKKMKNNINHECIFIKSDNTNITPVLDLEEMFILCKNDRYFINTICFIINKQLQDVPDLPNLSKDFILKNVYFSLINQENNVEMLKKIKSIPFMDLSITYRINLTDDEHSISSTYINQKLMEIFDIKEEELFKHAWLNTNENYRCEITPLTELLDMPFYKILSEYYPFYIITSKSKRNGSIGMLDVDILEKATKKIGTGIKIICPVQEELFVVPETVDSKLLKMIIKDIQQNVTDCIKLSESIYIFDLKTKKLKKAVINE